MPAETPVGPLTLAILAGGEGSRMGQPKGLLEIRGRPILSYLLQKLAWPGPTLLVTAPGREHPPAWQEFDREVTDPVAGIGPLRGLLTALQHAMTPLVAVLTVDMPAVTAEQIHFLQEQMSQRAGAMGILLQRSMNGEQRIEPFPSLFRKAAEPLVADQLAKGRRAMHGLAQDPRVALATAPATWPASVWTNLNDPTDLQQYLASL